MGREERGCQGRRKGNSWHDAMDNPTMYMGGGPPILSNIAKTMTQGNRHHDHSCAILLPCKRKGRAFLSRSSRSPIAHFMILALLSIESGHHPYFQGNLTLKITRRAPSVSRLNAYVNKLQREKNHSCTIFHANITSVPFVFNKVTEIDNKGRSHSYCQPKQHPTKNKTANSGLTGTK